MALHAVEAPLPDEIEVGEFRVRPAEGTLATADRRTRLEPKVAAVLAHLVRHRDRMVTREEMLDAVWSGVAVAPIALARAVSELRGALGDDPRAPRYIETYPKRGYRLVAPVNLRPRTAPAPPSAPEGVARGAARRPAAMTLALALAALTAASQVKPARLGAEPHVVVVAPFRSLDPTAAGLAAVLTADVHDMLVRTGDVTVALEGQGREPLRGGSVLEATVRSHGARVQVTAHLVARPGGVPLWSEAYERDADLDASGRSEIAGRIVHGLRIHGLRARDTREARDGGSPAPARAPTELELFRHGRALMMRRDLKGAVEAQDVFERAVRHQPRFTLARTGLVLALSMQTAITNDPAPARSAVREAEACVAVDPDLAEAHQALARANLVLGHYGAAARAVDEALRLRPDLLMALADRARLLSLRGELDRAWRAELDLHARDYPPWRAYVRGLLGHTLLVLDQRAQARRWLEHALGADRHDKAATIALARAEVRDGERTPARRRLQELVAVDPSCRPCLVELGRIALQEGALAESRRFLDRALDAPGERADALVALAMVERREGAHDRARERLAEAETEVLAAVAAGHESGELRLTLAAVAAIGGDRTAAARWCGEAVDAGWRDHAHARTDPAFAGLRGDARFDSCLERARVHTSEVTSRQGRVPLPAS